MGLTPIAPLRAVLLLAVIVRLASASGFISDDVFAHRASGGRSLLQTQTSCPMSFEFQNYTIITSKCKGPTYPVEPCCSAFKDFACPFSDYLNNLTNDCASSMFSYINLNGNYPPGLFSSECRDDKSGLNCPASPPQSQSDSNSGNINQSLISITFLLCGIILKFLLS
ncbi:GPI-anchored protein LORELEI-like isoform X2 [Canna indica]|uniref:GPI-anchored protein LORELEI-like isoform X2 n=1 Tax=Canna indica TaxID=4628 RepID=A0AAQ3KX74_9LILI|nr:GPI-anchored protein LORELEI-like isoform X2 [Canna indica]